jgi:hypothetical protein
MQRTRTFRSKSFVAISAFSVVAACGLALGLGCTSNDDDEISRNAAALAACGLDDGTVEHSAHLRACDPSETKKTTICHIPPGNPANAHTLCIGNPAVAAHLRNHGDHLGPCEVETPCPPPPSGGTGGADAPNTGGMSGGGEGEGTGGMTGATGGSGGVVIIVE